eukprot:g66954.t1
MRDLPITCHSECRKPFVEHISILQRIWLVFADAVSKKHLGMGAETEPGWHPHAPGTIYQLKPENCGPHQWAKMDPKSTGSKVQWKCVLCGFSEPRMDFTKL